MALALKDAGRPYQVIEFSPYGYDERQYCSPGFNLPVGCLMRSQHGNFAEYHTSADNLAFIKAQHLQESCEIVEASLQILEGNRRYINRNPKCEPQLGKRGLYQGLVGLPDQKQYELAMLWLLNQSMASMIC